MTETLSGELRFRAKVNDRVPPNELLAWADKIEAMEQRPTIQISDGDVFLHFPNAAISIEGICRYGAKGPIVRKNLRKWRDEILANAQKEKT